MGSDPAYHRDVISLLFLFYIPKTPEHVWQFERHLFNCPPFSWCLAPTPFRSVTLTMLDRITIGLVSIPRRPQLSDI